MLSFYCFLMCLIVGCLAGSDSKSIDENALSDYYWREYVGIIPNDALPGGYDKSGKRTYIGQMFAKGALLPATIYEGSKQALASAQGASISQEKFVKILCTRNPNRYFWVPTENSKTHLLTTVHLVIGGTESGFVLNIGRLNHEMEVVIGKIFASHTPYKGLTIPYHPKEVTYQTYEILIYRAPEYLQNGNVSNVSIY